MDQNELRALEYQCIQEHAPACAAACPARVDGRAFCAEIAKGNFPAALKILRKGIPFPGVISRICDQPCQAACVRKDAGGAIVMAALEKLCVDSVAMGDKVSLLPRRDQHLAVIGGGLSGLTVAYDLARKGYEVTVFEKTNALGGSLQDFPEHILPPSIVTQDFAILQKIGVEIILKQEIFDIKSGEKTLFNICGKSFDALYMGCGMSIPTTFGFAEDPHGKIAVDPLTYATEREGIFAGGGAVDHPSVTIGNPAVTFARSPVVAISDGHRAATSIDRFFQNVSLNASRNLEGSYTTRLYTSLVGIPAQPAIQADDPKAGYSKNEAMLEAQRCIQCECLECVKVCEYLKHYGNYPKRYLREIYNNLSIVKGERQKNKFINSCSLCGLCGEICPEDLNMGDVILGARRIMATEKRMPPSAHDFALRDMAFSNSENFALTMHAPGCTESDYLFFPGCQLCASSPDQVFQTFSHLLGKIGKVGMALRCCGAPAEWAGRTDLFEAAQEEFLVEYQKMGAPELILACSSCFHIFKKYYPQIKIHSLWTVLDQLGIPDEVQKVASQKTLALHDPCTTRYETEIQDSVRNLLGKMGFQVEELPLNRQKTECCSYGGVMWLANKDLAHQVVQRRTAQSPNDYVTYCAMCRDFFAGNGKPTHHLLDLMYNPKETLAGTLRKGPDYSLRHENRSRLKRKILKEHWGRDMETPANESIHLIISEPVRSLMEERLILEEDIQAVIAYAEKTGMKMLNRDKGHFLAYYKPGSVTYWVEYSPEDEAFIIHNTYSHRMVIEE